MAVVVMATWTAQPGREGIVRDALRHLASASRAEAGNVAYQPFIDPQRPQIFRIFEVYADAAALEAHRGSEHFRTYATEMGIPALFSRDVELYETVD